MKPEWKEKWVAALRSGKYEQGQGALWRLADNTYCCLGVLCHLVNPNAWQKWSIEYDETDHEVEVELENASFGFHSAYDDSYPPHTLEAVLGMTRRDFERCAEWNDEDHKTFAEIADKIEEVF